MSTSNPWFNWVTTVQDAANWTLSFFETNMNLSNALANIPQMYIAETGWPTFSSTAQGWSNGVSDASEPNLQIFINNFVRMVNAQSIKYFIYEFTDSPWMQRLPPGSDGFNGLFHNNRTLKALTLPDCAHD